jgi:cytochrome c-type biogenesis protein CcmH/NrfG
MMDINRTSTKRWTRVRSNSLAVVCLLTGIIGGWFTRGSQSLAIAASRGAASVSTQAATAAPQAANPARLKEMADAQTAPLLGKLKSDPGNADLLTSIGNLYYDAQQYPIAVDYYGRALKARPADAAVRTDMATAYWYMGNADAAIAEFDKALTYQPNNPNTLFNLGLVKWQGKRDSAGAVADWEKLLATNPNYEGKDKVEQMMAEAKKQPVVKH